MLVLGPEDRSHPRAPGVRDAADSMTQRIGDESPKARQAWSDYLALGPDRSLERLINRTEPKTYRLASLKQWSARHGWQARLQAIADSETTDATAKQSAYVRGILESGFGLEHERVKALNELADVLLEELRDPKRRWVTDMKWLGSRENGQVVEVERFNAAEFEQFRGLLDDIAKEVGGRVRKAELTGPASGAIEVRHTVDDASARVLADLLAVGLAGSSGTRSSS